MVLTEAQYNEFRRVRTALKAFAAAEGSVSWLDASCIQRFVAANPAGLNATELGRAQAWRTAAVGPFFVMRHTGSCTIFMNALGTFAVRGTEQELERLVPQTPTLVDVTLLPFDGLIVCADNPRFDPATAGEAPRADIDATYRSLADKGVIYSAAAMARVVRDGHAPERVVPEPRLAPIEMLRPVAPSAAAPSIPAGLAQVIAFKPRPAAKLVCS